MPAHEHDAGLVEPAVLAGVVEVVHDLVAARKRCPPVEVAGDGLVHAGHTLGLGEQLARSQQRLDGMHA